MSDIEQQQAINDILSSNNEDDDDEAKISALADLVDINATSTVKIINILNASPTFAYLKKRFITFMQNKNKPAVVVNNNNNNSLHTLPIINNNNNTVVVNNNTTHSQPIHTIINNNNNNNDHKRKVDFVIPTVAKRKDLKERLANVMPSFIQSGGLTESVKSLQQKQKEVWAESVYSAVLESVVEETGGAGGDEAIQPFPLTEKKVAMFVRVCSHLGYTFGSIRNSLIPALKRINIDRYGFDIDLDATRSLVMKQAYAYCKKYAEDDEAGEGNAFTMYDWKYVSTTLPIESPEYWRDSLILFFPLMTAARCITMGNFRDRDIISCELCSGSVDADNNRDDDDDDAVVVGGGVNKTAQSHTYKMVINLKITKNDANWNKKMILFGRLDEHENWREDLVYIMNKFILERTGSTIGIRELIQKMKAGQMNGDRLFVASKDISAEKSMCTSPDNVASLVNNLRHVFSHRTFLAGYPERFFHFHDGRAGFLSTIIIKNNIDNNNGNSLLYKAAILGGWVPNGRSINLYFRKNARHQLSPTTLLTDGLAPFSNPALMPESFHHLQDKLASRWKSSTIYDYFQAFIKGHIKNVHCENNIDGIYAELCRRMLVHFTDLTGLVDDKGMLRKGVLNDEGVLKSFAIFYKSTHTNESQRSQIRQMMIQNMDKWMDSYRHRDGRPSMAEETRYLQLIMDEKQVSGAVVSATRYHRKRESTVEFISVFPSSIANTTAVAVAVADADSAMLDSNNGGFGEDNCGEDVVMHDKDNNNGERPVAADINDECNNNNDDQHDDDEDDDVDYVINSKLNPKKHSDSDDNNNDNHFDDNHFDDIVAGEQTTDIAALAAVSLEDDDGRTDEWYDIERVRIRNIEQQNIVLEKLGLKRNTVLDKPPPQQKIKRQKKNKTQSPTPSLVICSTRQNTVIDDKNGNDDDNDDDNNIDTKTIWTQGTWSVDEDILLKELAEKYERKWCVMEHNRGDLNRSQTQMKDRIRKIEKDQLEEQKWIPSKGKWTSEEDKFLAHLMEKYNNKWSQMEVNRGVLNRNQYQMKDRARQIERDKQKSKQIHT